MEEPLGAFQACIPSLQLVTFKVPYGPTFVITLGDSE